MEKVFISKNDIYRMVAEDNGLRYNQRVVGWHYSGDEIVFNTNRKTHETEHYDLIDFVAKVCRNFPEVNGRKCNQFGYSEEGGEFFFYRDEGATDCHSIPKNRTVEKAYVRISWKVDTGHEEWEYPIPEEVLRRMRECTEYKPYFDLEVVRKVYAKDVPFGQRREWENCVYWVIPDEQMRRIEYTMWWRNQFAQVFDLDGEGHIRGYMDGTLYTEDGVRIMLGSDAQPDMYTHSPAFAHVGSQNDENTHAMRLG